MKKSILFFYLLSFFSTAYGQTVKGSGASLIGQDSTNRVITSSVPFLNITPDARSAGLGDTGVATPVDANGSYWNAAKLAFIDKGYGASISYTPWLGKIVNDMYIFYLTGFYKINRLQTMAASMRYFNLGEIQFNNGPDISDQLGRYTPREFSFDVTYSRLLTENFSIGGSLRYINSNLTGSLSVNSNDARPANTAAVDIGIFYTKPVSRRNNSTLALGLSVTNLGGKISYSNAANNDFLPINLRIGGAYTLEADPVNKFTFALDFNKLLVPSPAIGSKSKSFIDGVLGSFTDAKDGFPEEIREVTTSIGIEYWYNNLFAGRLGYFYEPKDKGNRKYLTTGVGLRYNYFGLDVAYLIPTNGRESALAETLRISLMVLFDKKTKKGEIIKD